MNHRCKFTVINLHRSVRQQSLPDAPSHWRLFCPLRFSFLLFCTQSHFFFLGFLFIRQFYICLQEHYLAPQGMYDPPSNNPNILSWFNPRGASVCIPLPNFVNWGIPPCAVPPNFSMPRHPLNSPSVCFFEQVCENKLLKKPRKLLS